MSRRTRQPELSTDHDSFLDIVANIVGILIILVVLVGVRAKNAPLTVSIPGPGKQVDRVAENDDADMKQQEIRIRGEILEMNRQALRLAEQAVDSDRQRDTLALMVSATQHGIEEHRKRLDDDARDRFDLRRQLAEQQARLMDVIRESLLIHQEKDESKPIDLEHRPTPISHTVHGREVHLLVRDGRVVVVPFEKLVERFKDEFERKAYQLQYQNELTDTMGPIDDFRLRYTIERIDTTPERFEQTGRGGSVVRLRRIEFLPISHQLGETIDEALAAGSTLRNTLARYRPDRDTVTIWTYPDGFGDYQRLKKLIYQKGFDTAARPLPFGVPISASPAGSRSAAQ